MLPASRLVGFVACGILRVRDSDEKRANNRRIFVLADGIANLKAMDSVGSLVGKTGLCYASEVVHNEVPECAEILILWLHYTSCRRNAHLYATARIDSYQSLETICSPACSQPLRICGLHITARAARRHPPMVEVGTVSDSNTLSSFSTKNGIPNGNASGEGCKSRRHGILGH